jgi:hypothetical protein
MNEDGGCGILAIFKCLVDPKVGAHAMNALRGE